MRWSWSWRRSLKLSFVNARKYAIRRHQSSRYYSLAGISHGVGTPPPSCFRQLCYDFRPITSQICRGVLNVGLTLLQWPMLRAVSWSHTMVSGLRKLLGVCLLLVPQGGADADTALNHHSSRGRCGAHVAPRKVYGARSPAWWHSVLCSSVSRTS